MHFYKKKNSFGSEIIVKTIYKLCENHILMSNAIYPYFGSVELRLEAVNKVTERFWGGFKIVRPS